MISDWTEVAETFDAMGLHENLLRGIYAYGACQAPPGLVAAAGAQRRTARARRPRGCAPHVARRHRSRGRGSFALPWHCS
jgi:hypothetical protein